MQNRGVIYTLFGVFLFMTIALWFEARSVKPQWETVPPSPSETFASAITLGDEQFAYRYYGLALQNFGDTGGRTTHISDYNFKELEDWLFLMDHLDPRSDFIPNLAAYYFGATHDPEDLDYVIPYLRMVGNRNYGEKWRWLAQAVYMARFKQEDYELGFTLAQELASQYQEGMPAWVLQMPAFVKRQAGEKEAAYDLLISILRSSADKLHPNEVNHTRSVICDRILDEGERRDHPLCQDPY